MRTTGVYRNAARGVLYHDYLDMHPGGLDAAPAEFIPIDGVQLYFNPAFHPFPLFDVARSTFISRVDFKLVVTLFSIIRSHSTFGFIPLE